METQRAANRKRCDDELRETRRAEAANADPDEAARLLHRKKTLKAMRQLGIYKPPDKPSASWSWLREGLTAPKIAVPTETDEATLFVGTAGFGTTAGFCTGYALKLAGRAAAFTAGVVFMSLTAAERSGFIEVRWDRVREATVERLDVDGDRRLTSSDASSVIRTFADYMTGENAALTGSSFTAGLLLGLRRG